MNNGCLCSADQRWPRSLLATRRQARLLYVLCVLASFASMLLLAYSTSSRNTSGNFSKNTAELSPQVGNVAEENRVVWRNISEINPKTFSINRDKTYSFITSSNKFQAPIFYNCSIMDTSSELLSMDVPRYNPKFKNPCWYEDLTDYDVYSNNKFAEYYHSVKSVFIKLSSHWKKKFAEETNPRRLRCLPYFFIAGQPKCGSTDLYKKLISHPDVGSPPIKECHWWGKNRYGWRSNYTTSLPFNDYIDLFDGVSNDIETRSKGQDISNIITGDASVSTLWDNDEWWRLKENCGHTEPKYTNANYVHHFLPNAKIIIVLRDPVDRLWSDYLYFQKTSKSAEDFHMNAAKAISFHINCTQKYTLTACIYNRTLANLARVRLRIGIYYAYLENWLNIYPRDQFLVIRLEDYAVNTRNIMKNVFRFLKLRDLTKAESDFIIGQPVANSRRKGDKKYGTMNESTRKMLEDFYEPYNKRLALLLNDNRYMWKKKDRTSAGAGKVQESRDPRVRS